MSIEQKQFFEAGVKAERERIVDLLLEGDFVRRAKTPDSGLFAVFYYLVNNADWLSDKDVEALHERVIAAVDDD
jgi:hypothetical protein